MPIILIILGLSLALVRCERAEPVVYQKKLSATQQAFFIGLLESRNPVVHRRGQQAFEKRWNRLLGLFIIILIFPLGLWFERRRKHKEEGVTDVQ